MNAAKNIFAIIGVLAIVLLLVLYSRYGAIYQRFQEFDPKATEVYGEMMDVLMETGNAAEATVWRVKVEKDVSIEDVEEAMRSVANEANFKNVGELPLSDQITSMTGREAPYLKIFLFCDPLVGLKMFERSTAYAAYFPCRIIHYEDKDGQRWLITMNMDMLIHGGEVLPPELKKGALRVRSVIQEIMQRGAAGEF
jgi:uncharacterized protein (DUF302 family)